MTKKITCKRILNESPEAREKRLRRQRAHYLKHKEKYLKKYKDEYHKNIEQSRIKAKKLREKETPEQRQKRLAYLREWRKRPGKKQQMKKLSQTDKYKYIQYKNQSAARRKKGFGLTFDEFVHIFHSPCYLCGQENARGIDRIDNEIGYYAGNIEACCQFCNLIKWKHGVNDLLDHIAKIAKHRGII